MAQQVFAALADPTRRQVFELLAGRGPATATELSRELPVSRQAVSRHLAVLGRAGLVAREATGREVRFAARSESLSELVRWVSDVGAEWDERLARLRSLVEDA